MSTAESIPQIGKGIVWSCSDLDYSAYLDGEYVGSYPTYPMAEAALNRLALERLQREARGGIWAGRETAQ